MQNNHSEYKSAEIQTRQTVKDCVDIIRTQCNPEWQINYKMGWLEAADLLESLYNTVNCNYVDEG